MAQTQMKAGEAMPAATASGSSEGALLRVDGIHKKFGGTYALRDISFSVDRGEVLALLGENGAGKSTLIKILASVPELDQGNVIFDGENATRHISDLPIAFIRGSRPHRLDDRRGECVLDARL